MAQRGRKSAAAALGVVVINTEAQRLKPPANLPDEAKTLFNEIVQACDPRHFRPAERPLLLAYVRALLIERHFGNQITGDRTDIGLNQWERAVKVATSPRASVAVMSER